MTRTSGLTAFTALDTPEISPPPPIGTTTVWTSGRSSTSSRPSVPWPAISSRSSNGWTYVRPRSATSSSAFSLASSQIVPCRTTSAPYPRVASTLAGVAFSAITTTARMPCSAAASATPCAWLPADEQITPAAFPRRSGARTCSAGPRSLYEPVRWNDSALRETSKPVAALSDADPSSGVRRACTATCRWASRNTSSDRSVASILDRDHNGSPATRRTASQEGAARGKARGPSARPPR